MSRIWTVKQRLFLQQAVPAESCERFYNKNIVAIYEKVNSGIASYKNKQLNWFSSIFYRRNCFSILKVCLKAF